MAEINVQGVLHEQPIQEKPQRSRRSIQRRRARRKRQRRNRRLRKQENEQKEEALVRRTVQRDNTNLLRNGHVLKRNKNIQPVNPMTYTNVFDEMSEEAKQYLASVVSPFSARAVGAVRPTKFKKDVLPATDKISFQFSASNFGSEPSSTVEGDGISGIVFCFLPRCRKAGFQSGKTVYPAGTGQVIDDPIYVPSFPLLPTSDTLVLADDPSETGGDAYNIIAFGVDTLGRPHIKVPDENQTFADAFGAYLIRTTRFPNIQQNSDALSILGAGMRVNTTAAPINSGGYCFAGSVKAEEFSRNLTSAAAGTVNLDQWLMTNIEDQYRGKAINGAMVRLQYDKNTLQQHDTQLGTVTSYVLDINAKPTKNRRFAPPARKRRKLNNLEVLSIHSDEEEKDGIRLTKDGKPGDVGAVVYADLTTNLTETAADPANQDFFGVSSLIPTIYWKFESVSADDQYNLVFDAVVHVECLPKQISPFQAVEVERDLMMSFITEEAFNDTVKFPAAHSANSFKSLMLHLKKIAGAVRDGATKFEKAFSLFY